MNFGKIVRYCFSLLIGVGSFFLIYGLLQYFVTRNLSDPIIAEVGKLILNYATAGMTSGAAYAATFNHGYLPLATIPVVLIGGVLLTVAIIRGEIGGIEPHPTLNAWEFAIPVFIGICCGYIGARIVRRIQVPKKS